MIVYYISSHGFGHTVRACEVIRNLPHEIPLTLRTGVPEWFLRQELEGRAFDLEPEQFDCGVVGPDSVDVDPLATLDRIEPILDRNDRLLEGEVEWLRRRGARLVVADIVPFALRAARSANVPSILIANFTWPAIYRHLLDRLHEDNALADRLRCVIDQIQHDDDQGDLLLATDMRIPMRACRVRHDVPLVTRRGENRRHTLVERLDLDAKRPIGLLYLGREGMEGLRWERFAKLDIQLVTYGEPPETGSGRITSFPEDLMRHGDLAASVDFVIAKAGYGICGECIAASTPMLYPPRPGFAEQTAVEEIMARWGGGIAIPEEPFKALAWRPYLEQVGSLRMRPEAVDCTGGEVCAGWIEEAWRGESIPPFEKLG